MVLRTVEHFLAALCAVGLPPVRVEVDGPELPILDGSAAPVFEALVQGGLSPGFSFVELAKELEVTVGKSQARLRPIPADQQPRMTARLQLGPGAPRFDPICFFPVVDDFARDIAPARTFCRWEDVAPLREAGLIRGGSLDCALVLDEDGPMRGQSYRLPDEPVRHKILDAIGDLSLLGGLPWADIELVSPGHALVHEVVRRAAPWVRPLPWLPRP
jgi:UDP-3-O-[3-hydroxymyristoyl] N-acetylglucosamine deacetylase